MSIIDRISSVLLSFLLALFIAIASICSIVRLTFCSPSFMVSVLNNQNYYNVIYDEYCEAIEQLAIPAGVAEGVFSNAVSKAEFKTYIKTVIFSAYDGSMQYAGNVFPYEEIYSRFYNTMLKTAADSGVTVDDELTVGIDNVSTLLANSTQQFTDIPFIDTIGKYSFEISSYLEYVIFGSVVIFALFLSLLVFTKKWRDEWLNVLSLAVRSSGAMLIVAPLIVLFSNVIKYLSVDVKSLYLFAVGYSETIIWISFILGIILFLLGCIPQLINLIKYLKLKKQGRTN